eukprot:1676284-Rhodomonas_salina.3
MKGKGREKTKTAHEKAENAVGRRLRIGEGERGGGREGRRLGGSEGGRKEGMESEGEGKEGRGGEHSL